MRRRLLNLKRNLDQLNFEAVNSFCQIARDLAAQSSVRLLWQISAFESTEQYWSRLTFPLTLSGKSLSISVQKAFCTCALAKSLSWLARTAWTSFMIKHKCIWVKAEINRDERRSGDTLLVCKTVIVQPWHKFSLLFVHIVRNETAAAKDKSNQTKKTFNWWYHIDRVWWQFMLRTIQS
jgi:hypothetical protein